MTDFPYKHALCLHPYFRDSHSGSLGIAVFPPIGLEYIAAAVEPYVEKVTFVDLRMPGPLRDPERLKKYIQQEVDLLCVSINWEYFFPEACELVNSLSEGVTTVVGGQQATLYVSDIMERCPGVDILVRGEGEESIAEIAQGVELSEILGVSYRSGGDVKHNENRRFPEIDVYPSPDRALRSSKYHFNIGGAALRGEEFDIMLTSRGCPYNCKFCTFNLNPWTLKRRYSMRSIDSVMEELRKITAGIILIADENFFVNPKRALELCKRIAAEKLDKSFVVQSRIEIYEHPEVLEAAVEAGVKIVLFGVESPTDRILEQLNKGFDTAKLRVAFKVLRQYQMYYHGYFIYGNVTETEEEMMRIPVFAKELGLDSITYQKLRIEKYSPLKELVEATPGYYVGDDNIVYSEGLGRPYLKRISRQITRKFYTPSQLSRTMSKLLKVGIVKRSALPALVATLPIVVGRMVGRKIDKQMRRLPIWSRMFSN